MHKIDKISIKNLLVAHDTTNIKYGHYVVVLLIQEQERTGTDTSPSALRRPKRALRRPKRALRRHPKRVLRRVECRACIQIQIFIA